MAEMQHAWLAASRDVWSLSCVRPVGPTYKVDRGSKHMFEQHRTSSINRCSGAQNTITYKAGICRTSPDAALFPSKSCTAAAGITSSPGASESAARMGARDAGTVSTDDEA